MEDWSYAETVTWLVKRDDREVAATTKILSAEHQKYERALIALTLSVDPSKVIDIDADDKMIFKAARAGQITPGKWPRWTWGGIPANLTSHRTHRG